MAGAGFPYTTTSVTGLDNAAAVAVTGGTITGLTSLGTAGTITLRNVDARKDGAWNTVVDATPGSSLLGQAATTAGVNFVGNAYSGGGTATGQDYAQIDAILPAWYISGASITVRVRAKWTTTLLTVASKVDVEVKVAADGTLGSDICTTAEQSLSTSFANKDFVVTPTSRVAGDCLTIRFSLRGDDTGGAINTAGAISSISLVLGAS